MNSFCFPYSITISVGFFPAASSFLSLSEARPHHDFSPNRKTGDSFTSPARAALRSSPCIPGEAMELQRFFRKRWAFVGLHMVIICYNNQCSMFPAMGGRQKKTSAGRRRKEELHNRFVGACARWKMKKRSRVF